VAGLRLPHHRVVGTLPGLLALEFVGECRDREQQLVGGGVERSLAAFQVEPHPYAGLHQLLQRVGRFDRLTTEA
jgi:hypothetical protein